MPPRYKLLTALRSVVIGVTPRVFMKLTPNSARFSLGYIVLTFGIWSYAIDLLPHRSHTKRCAGFAGGYGPGWRNTRL